MGNDRFIRSRLLLAVSWTIIVFILLIMRTPPEMSGVKIPGLDKIAHIGVFGILCFLYLWSLTKYPSRKVFITVVSLCSFYGILLEMLQGLSFTGRDFDIFDIIANIIGANIAAAIFYILNQVKYD